MVFLQNDITEEPTPILKLNVNMSTTHLLPMLAHSIGSGYESMLKLTSIFMERQQNMIS